ncbi:D-alanyl-lipoteichoic acid biosynthesis protein DltB [Clostridium botulinum]|uniref:D-alanyl-lipoteichoic acid biosynthesis protein DltB n=1 Tax=Clostridium botulinum TaxID=1491 RepID=UPI001A932CBE|nr:D-alanyl-lipoteichoic acid biosynthesis protein DltB [Clostridium botulinum]MBO0523439.1 D-alanyl-lipoteichoic acid biosynthesis protein DltB [Clostridium botulinum]MBO0533140.1 D-alanyl-lipoteichoic acid biosynthesis protein DltB [Clostridium botulinum]MBO0533843.1 D-alanyl-lipoteichoic acid biosynthesis protein DltB [Clostridium botulinum]MBO0540130.1 D-alanyl-lipoteichoic acid biosynthesis protein DltB [Clostridium botulinum]MBO0543280.1 D-alanyl-lipoteichoic acid biosynthesis protein Dl
MIPYSNLLFFYIMFVLLIPAILLGIYEKPIKKYGLIVNMFMIFLFVRSNKIEWICLIAFYIGQVILVKAYTYIRKKTDNVWIMRIILLLSLIPLILVKFNRFITVRTIGFIGISYVTFRTIEILIETYDGLIKDINLLEYTYFILFFPTVSSGPIDRFRRFKEDIHKKITRKEYVEEFLSVGIRKIFTGVLYKFIIAALISNLWMDKIPKVHSLYNTLSYMYCYSLYLFFDFAGYSLMAIGTGYILGVKVSENFNKPFISKDIKEFWNRWHMSLSFWFRDFIYTRFVMNSMRKKRFKNRYTSSYIGYFITMLVMGIWHGIYIHYLVYGLYEGILLAGTDYFQKNSKFYKKNKKKKWFKYVSVFITFNLVCFGLLIFSGYLYNK